MILLLHLLALVGLTWADMNRTIDDTNGDSGTKLIPIYSGSVHWNTQIPSVSLSPDKGQLAGGTWHAALATDGDDAKITINFSGTSIYVFFVLVSNTTALTQVQFSLDGQQLGEFTHSVPPPNSNNDDEGDASPPQIQYLYNQPVLVKNDLQDGSHQLIISSTGDESKRNFVLFDNAIYTQSDSSGDATQTENNPSSTSTRSQSNSHFNTGTILGAIIGALVAATILLSLLICYYRRRSRTTGGFLSEKLSDSRPKWKAERSLPPFPPLRAPQQALDYSQIHPSSSPQRESLTERSVPPAGPWWNDNDDNDHSSSSGPTRTRSSYTRVPYNHEAKLERMREDFGLYQAAHVVRQSNEANRGTYEAGPSGSSPSSPTSGPSVSRFGKKVNEERSSSEPESPVANEGVTVKGLEPPPQYQQ